MTYAIAGYVEPDGAGPSVGARRTRAAKFTPPERKGFTVMTTKKIQIAITADPEQIWNVLVDPSISPAYYLGFSAEFDDLTPGSGYRYTAGGGDMITGEILSVDPGRELSTTFNGLWAPDVAALPTSRVTFNIFEPFMPMPGVTFLACTHDRLPESETADHLEIGWVTILSGLKSVLETGAPLGRRGAAKQV